MHTNIKYIDGKSEDFCGQITRNISSFVSEIVRQWQDRKRLKLQDLRLVCCSDIVSCSCVECVLLFIIR